jgi:hypothetical protein
VDDISLKTLLEDVSGRQYWLKPIGLPNRPIENRQPEVWPESPLDIHFARNPAAVAERDILIAFRTGESKIIFVAERPPGGPYPTEDNTLPEWVRKRYPLFYKARNLTPVYGKKWRRYSLKPFALAKKFNAKHPDRQPVKLGALNFGSDKLRIDQLFAEFLIRQILGCHS